MNDKIGNNTFKMRTIKKPKFLAIFAVCLVSCLLAGSIASYCILFSLRDQYLSDAEDIKYYRVENAVKCLKNYYEADDENRDRCYNVLEWYLIWFSYVTGEYGAVYIGDEKIMETPKGLYAACLTDGEDGHTQFDFLEDASYLAPLASCENGKYDPEVNIRRINDIYINSYMPNLESELRLFATRAGLLAGHYEYNWENLYLDENTHRFIPGKAKICRLDSFGEPECTVDCTPSDTKGYKRIEAEGDGGFSFHKMGYRDPAKSNEPVKYYFYDDYLEDRNIGETDEGEWDHPWSFRTTDTEQISDISVFKLMPLTVALVITITVLTALIIAFVISTVIYHRKKAVWEIFEYRKKTTAAMAHDLKTPLAALAAYAENLEYDVNSDKRTYYTSKIRENVDSMSRTVESILEFSKTGNGAVTVGISDINVRELILKEYKAAATLFEKNKIEFSVEGEGNVTSNRELLEQAVRNLVSNAAKYARSGTEVKVAIDAKGFTMQNLTDQKIENVESLKDPFVKGEDSRGEESGGGLGLSIADTSLIAAGHKLDIEVDGDLFKSVVRW